MTCMSYTAVQSWENVSEQEENINENKTDGEQQNADSRQARQHSSRTDMLNNAAAEASPIFSRNGTAQLNCLHQRRIEQKL